MTAPTPPAAPPRAARILGAAGRGLVTVGVVVLAFVAYQIWGTSIQEARAQDDLRRSFEAALAAAAEHEQLASEEPGPAPSTTERPTSTTTSADPEPEEDPEALSREILALFFPEDGDAVARIEIPSIGVDKIVVHGVQVADLRKGPGHYDGTPTVGAPGNSSIAGHRTTYGAPFNRIDELEPGDEIRLTSALGRFTYRVLPPEEAYPDRLTSIDGAGAGHVIVRPSATWVLGEFGDNRVTLTACHPKYSARQRIIVAAELEGDPVPPPDAIDETAEPADEMAAPPPPAPSTTEPLSRTDPPTTTAEAVTPSLPAAEPAPPRSAASGAAVPSLDEGLGGEQGTVPGAVAWLLLASAIWIGAGVLGRQRFPDLRRRVAVRTVALLPAGVALWFAFELIDRALPAA